MRQVRINEDFTAYVYGFEIKYVSHYAMSVFNDMIFNSDEHWFSSDSQEPVIIDAGSNIGCVALYMKHYFPRAHILCFEPDDFLFSILKRNIVNNNLQNVELHNCALGGEDGECILYSSNDRHLSGGLGNSIKPDWGIQESPHLYDNSKKVQVKRLSPFINGKVDYLKIDVESAECDVIFEIREKLHLIKQLHVEVHSLGSKNREEVKKIANILEENNFHCEIDDSSPSLPPWTKKWANQSQPNIRTVRAVNLRHIQKSHIKKKLDSFKLVNAYV
ncbi:MAG: FkbM family methyltransferase [Pseudomonadota bacterium]|nr:FkbM family methyltransferase [Pseudomonadota bacterium]